jgi:hypothetical protein
VKASTVEVMPIIPTKNSPEYVENKKRHNKYVGKALKSQASDRLNITGKPS